MYQFTLALGLFLLSHALPSYRPVRRRLVAAAGERGFMAAYSLLSLALLAWVVDAALHAPYIALWQPPGWVSWLPAALMAPACILLAAGLSTPNPYSLGRPAADHPPRPGVLSITRHPVLWAVALWAVAHVLVNGNLVAVVLFGTFFAMSVMGMIMLDRRHRRRMGPQRWREHTQGSSALPFTAALAGRVRVDWHGIGAGRIGAGVALFLVLLAAHPYVIGLPPIPGYR